MHARTHTRSLHTQSTAIPLQSPKRGKAKIQDEHRDENALLAPATAVPLRLTNSGLRLNVHGPFSRLSCRRLSILPATSARCRSFRARIDRPAIFSFSCSSSKNSLLLFRALPTRRPAERCYLQADTARASLFHRIASPHSWGWSCMCVSAACVYVCVCVCVCVVMSCGAVVCCDIVFQCSVFRVVVWCVCQ